MSGGALGGFKTLFQCRRHGRCRLYDEPGKKNKTAFAKKTEDKKKGQNNTPIKQKLSLSEFLEKIAQKTDDNFGKQFRGFFADNKGSAELAMLASPSKNEIGQLRKAVAIMTENGIKKRR